MYLIPFVEVKTSVVDPDPDWIRIQWGPRIDPDPGFVIRIWIRIQEGRDDPEAQKKNLINLIFEVLDDLF
jgi:hypothetical protein